MRLIHGDALEILPTLAAGSVDLVLADMPYGVTSCRWDSVIDLERLWPLLRRVAKSSAAIVLFAAQPFTSALVMSNPREFRYEWIWQKDRAANVFFRKVQPLRYHESVVVFSESPSHNQARHPAKYNPQMTPREARNRRRNRAQTSHHSGIYGDDRLIADPATWGDSDTIYPKSVLLFGAVKGKMLHPTQKPLDLLAYLIRTYSNPGETVLDFCAGSGSTGLAAIQEGRDCILIERDAGHFATLEARIAAAQPPLPLAAG